MRDLMNRLTAEEADALENAELREAAAVSFVQSADEEDLVGCETGEDDVPKAS
jgi:hypothetical protein